MKKPLPPTILETHTKHKHYPIVAIGASAGGIEAVCELLRHLPSGTGMSYIYIQHLNPTHKSLLSSILAKATNMKVMEATNLMRIKPDHVIIIPPNKDMSLIDGVLKLTPREAKPSPHLPIDKFFLSLAKKNKEGAIGIVLSGNLSDGAIGLKAIKGAGGFTFAQDETAKYQSMPKAAIAEGGVDLILSPADIARELTRLSHEHLPGTDEPDDISGEDLSNILNLLRNATGVDFHHYKRNTINRRIVRRMILHKIHELGAYEQYLRDNESEVSILYQDLLINVTTFFRDQAVTEYLKKTLFPHVLARDTRDPVRIWVPACSTGEEAYSLAMLLVEVLGDKAISTPVQIFGTDLSTMSIGKARLGVYSREELADVSPVRLRRFFSKLDGKYRIVKSIRDMCIFAPHNILKDPPFSRVDIISCCNLFIYLDAALQKKVMSAFHYSLKNNGHLILGKSETIGASQNLFAPVHKKLKIYSRKKGVNDKLLIPPTYPITTEKQSMATPKGKTAAQVPKTADLHKTVDALLLDSYVPPCVIINEEMEIQEFRGSLGMFLEPSPGRASLNILKMAHGDLSFELRTAIHKVIKTDEAYRKGGIHIHHKKKTYEVTITVSPLKVETDGRYFLVLFHEIELSATSAPTSQPQNKRIQQLEKELRSAREEMRTIIEEQELVNEELQSANEEIVSSNEELQSINEEIETAKEELESSNEELLTINQELQARNEQLTEAYEYPEAVFATVREGVIVMDSDLIVKTANPAFCSNFHLLEEDVVGKKIFDLSNGEWDMPRLHKLLEVLLPGDNQSLGFEIKHDFRDLGEKVLMLNARRIIQQHHKKELVLLALEDITAQISSARMIAEREGWIRNAVNNIPVMMWVAGPDGLRTFFNKTWLQFTGKKISEHIGSAWMSSVHRDDLNEFLRIYQDAISRRAEFRIEYRLQRHDGEYLWIHSIGRPTFDQDGSFTGFIGICTEIHDKILMKNQLEKLVSERTHELLEANETLGRTNEALEQYAYVASHDLQEPLRKIITFGGLLQDSYNDQLPEGAKDYIRKIRGNAERMSALIHDLLSLSRLPRVEDDFSPQHLGQLIQSALNDFDLQISQKDAVIDIGKLPVLTVSPVYIRQLFYNLISNALKFATPAEPPYIRISSRRATKDDMVHVRGEDAEIDKRKFQLIEFADNGIGFEQRFADKVFQIFQRLNGKDEYSGSGIGLSIVRKIVENHQGYVSVTSQPGKGTKFSILLPL